MAISARGVRSSNNVVVKSDYKQGWRKTDQSQKAFKSYSDRSVGSKHHKNIHLRKGLEIEEVGTTTTFNCKDVFMDYF